MNKVLSIIVGVLLIFAGTACFSQETEPQAYVISFAGEVEVIPARAPDPIDIAPGTLIGQGDGIRTSEGAFLKIGFDKDKKNIVKINENSDVVVMFQGDNKLELINGEVIAMLKGLKKGETFSIVTPAAICGARGTGWLTRTDGEKTTIQVFDNKVFMRELERNGKFSEKEYWVKRGYERTVKRLEKPKKPVKIRTETLVRLQKEIGFDQKEGIAAQKERKPLIDARRVQKRIEADILDEKKLAAIQNKIESRTDLASRSVADRHAEMMGPAKMNIIEMRMKTQQFRSNQMDSIKGRDERQNADRINIGPEDREK